MVLVERQQAVDPLRVGGQLGLHLRWLWLELGFGDLPFAAALAAATFAIAAAAVAVAAAAQPFAATAEPFATTAEPVSVR